MSIIDPFGFDLGDLDLAELLRALSACHKCGAKLKTEKTPSGRYLCGNCRLEDAIKVTTGQSNRERP